MTDGLRRLVALAATLAPGRAVRLLGQLDVPGGAEAARLAGALAGSPRRVRLAALAASLNDSAALARPHAGGPVPSHPLLRRLERQRRECPAAARTEVRAAAGPSAPGREMAGRTGRHAS
jgi:hypothetical protein